MSETLREALKAALPVLREYDFPGAHPHRKAVYDQAIAALAAPQADAEPVAWRYRYEMKDGVWGKWTVQKNRPTWYDAYKAENSDVQVEPLYTAPPSQAADRMRDQINFYRRMSDAAVYSGPNVANILETMFDLSRADDGKESEGGASCQRCQGNGEIVTDWETYLHPTDLKAEEASVAECPDCDGEGKRPSDPTPAQERREEIARIIEPESFGALDRIYLIPTDKEFSCMAAARVKADAILALPPPKGEPSQEWNAAINASNIVAGSPSDPTPPDREAWPAGCRNPNSCSIHRDCMYLGCTHYDRDISGEIDVALRGGE